MKFSENGLDVRVNDGVVHLVTLSVEICSQITNKNSKL